MPRRGEEEEAPSAAGCYTFLRSASRRGRGYRRLDSGSAAAAGVRVEVGTTRGGRSVFHVDPAVLEAGPVRRLVAAAGQRIHGGAVALAVDALLFEHLLWLQAAVTEGLEFDDDLSEIVEFYSQDDDDDDAADHHGLIVAPIRS
ncbi:hypothetical protein GUJ93_ZPchr0013g35937 [Zizania palustris]|uniref:Uncharacterized protein n=1 Tax=Zizania palustris TaxID=103762 RepID=A0A8J5X3Q8_ZIZPA|nr:hypothetical protein GUJ93_ZPchr0013g35937 [Zizania palustris]